MNFQNDPQMRKNSIITQVLSDKTLYRQFNIRRWNSVETIKPQNLGEHHASVVQITLALIGRLEEMGYQLSDKTKFLAMAGASVHDLGEIEFGDMNYMLKVKNPALSEISNQIEHRFICKTMNYEKPFEEAQEDKLARAIYKLADALDMVFFVRREEELGSHNPELKAITTSTNKLVRKDLDVLFELLES